MIAVGVLGPVVVRSDGSALGSQDFGGVKPKQLLEMLVLARGRPVPKDRLADDLWGEKLPRNPSATLESYVSVLRSKIGKKTVETTTNAYRLATDLVTTDLDRFDGLVKKAASGGPRHARRHLEEALGLVRGELVEDEPYATWAEPQRRAYRERVLRARLDVAEAALACRDPEAALAHAERSLECDLLDERAHRAVMLAAYAAGHQSRAMRAFERCEKVLNEELGAVPAPETLELFEAIARHTPPAELLPAPAWDELPAVVDLQSRRAPFLDRTAESDALDAEFATALGGKFTLVMVQGAPGMGKTRLVQEAVGRLGEARVGWARCSRLEQDLPLAALTRALRGALGPDAPDPMTQVLPHLSPDAGEVGQIRAIRTLADLVTANGPTVLVLDDFQWVDEKTVTALGHLQRNYSTAPVAVVVVGDARQVGAGRSAVWLVPDRRLPLQAFDRATVDALEEGLYERTGGHPLLVATWLEVAAEDRDEELPVRLGPWVLEQTQAAGPSAHALVVTAALADEPFLPEQLAAVVQDDPMELVDELERLSRRGLVRPVGEGFSFRYPLVREALANSVSPARRHLVRQKLLGEGPRLRLA